ncbi:MAG TPA: hypothetical protein VFD26_01520 [Methyloceanibacter sp.]|nr:hypothetical protein [Methyloceanibacter sp.]
MTAQEWIAAAIASGRDPLIVQQPDGRFGLMTSLVDVDSERDPGPLPEGCGTEIVSLLRSLGRFYPHEVAS